MKNITQIHSLYNKLSVTMHYKRIVIAIVVLIAMQWPNILHL